MKILRLKQSKMLPGAVALVVSAAALANTGVHEGSGGAESKVRGELQANSSYSLTEPRDLARVRAGKLEIDPRYPLSGPEYPEPSIQRGEYGSVKLLIHVLPTGKVGGARIDRSSGYPQLDAAALLHAKRYWRFRPATYDGESVGEWGTYTITFKLTG